MTKSGSVGGEARVPPDAARRVGSIPVLSWLLLATTLTLGVSLAVRVSGLTVETISRPGVVADRVSSLAAAPVDIEPAAGPSETERPPPPASATPATPPPASRLEVLEELAADLRRHQAKLLERERAIGMREAVVAAVEARVHTQLDRLDAAKHELEQLLGQVSADEQARVAQLVKVYEAMKAKSAAPIFDPMPLELLLPIVRGMRETKVAAIIAEMDPAKARALTAELARSRDPPAKP